MTIKIGVILGIVGASIKILTSLMWMAISLGLDMGLGGYAVINFMSFVAWILILLFFISLLSYIVNKKAGKKSNQNKSNKNTEYTH